MSAASEPFFRAITCRGVRRGLRLERVYWDALADMSKSKACSVGDIIADIHEAGLEGSNSLSSAVRAHVMQHYFETVRLMGDRLKPASVGSIVHVISGPAFTLSITKRILHYNAAFIAFVQGHFAEGNTGEAFRGLALTLDTRIEDVLRQLEVSPNRPVSSGFAIGVSERRVRGKLNIALLPALEEPIVLATIVQ